MSKDDKNLTGSELIDVAIKESKNDLEDIKTKTKGAPSYTKMQNEIFINMTDYQLMESFNKKYEQQLETVLNDIRENKPIEPSVFPSSYMGNDKAYQKIYNQNHIFEKQANPELSLKEVIEKQFSKIFQQVLGNSKPLTKPELNRKSTPISFTDKLKMCFTLLKFCVKILLS